MFLPVSPQHFLNRMTDAAATNPRILQYCDYGDTEVMETYYCLIHASGRAGVVVKPAQEIGMLWSSSKGLGASALQAAVDWGGTWLSCCGHPDLVNYYGEHGFIIANTVANWGDGYDYEYMALPGHMCDVKVYEKSQLVHLCTGEVYAA